MLRKLALQCIAVLFSDLFVQGRLASVLFSLQGDSVMPACFLSSAVSMASWVIVGALALQLHCRPYFATPLNNLESGVLGVLFVTQVGRGGVGATKAGESNWLGVAWDCGLRWCEVVG